MEKGSYEQPLDGHADQKKGRSYEDNRSKIGIDPKIAVEEESEIHAQHHQIAVGEVDDPDDSEDQVQPDAEQGVNAPEEKPGDDHLNENSIHSAFLYLEKRRGTTVPRLPGSSYFLQQGVARMGSINEGPLGKTVISFPSRHWMIYSSARMF
jgi:hypothetical protein